MLSKPEVGSLKTEEKYSSIYFLTSVSALLTSVHVSFYEFHSYFITTVRLTLNRFLSVSRRIGMTSFWRLLLRGGGWFTALP